MKKLISSVVCCSMLLGTSVPCAFAFEAPSAYVQTVSTYQLSNGITVKERIIEYTHSSTRANSKTTAREQKYYKGDTPVGKIVITGTFAYDGKTSRVTSKSVSSKETYNGWSYTQNSFTSDGGTIELTGKLKKAPYGSIDVDLSLSCDKDGNIS